MTFGFGCRYCSMPSGTCAIFIVCQLSAVLADLSGSKWDECVEREVVMNFLMLLSSAPLLPPTHPPGPPQLKVMNARPAH